MFVAVGAVISMQAMIGTLVGTNAEMRESQLIGSYVSGLMQEANTVFLCL